MSGTVVRIKELQQLSEKEKWLSQVFYLNRLYRLGCDVYTATNSEDSQKVPGICEWYVIRMLLGMNHIGTNCTAMKDGPHENTNAGSPHLHRE